MPSLRITRLPVYENLERNKIVPTPTQDSRFTKRQVMPCHCTAHPKTPVARSLENPLNAGTVSLEVNRRLLGQTVPVEELRARLADDVPAGLGLLGGVLDEVAAV